jgi:hypothetical protein
VPGDLSTDLLTRHRTGDSTFMRLDDKAGDLSRMEVVATIR